MGTWNNKLTPGDSYSLTLGEAGTNKVTLRFADGTIVETYIDRNKPVRITAGEQDIEVDIANVEHDRDI